VRRNLLRRAEGKSVGSKAAGLAWLGLLQALSVAMCVCVCVCACVCIGRYFCLPDMPAFDGSRGECDILCCCGVLRFLCDT
jgi:hypothetical protein